MVGDGLSPLARGTREPKIFALWDCRFIPAGAGNTDFDVEKIRTSAVYPRWRGEHITRITRGFRTCGLSPLARGTHLFPHPVIYLQRFIPAGAGNTLSVTHSSNYQPVYPRWRGEHPMGIRYDNTVYGLSPLARGTPAGFCSYIPPFRFIPAGAGNMLFATQHGNKPPVYPRWRGEHLRQRAALRLIRGLSPLARGTHGWPGWLRCRKRFIPAGAGNTSKWRSTARQSAVYPRWRGEHHDQLWESVRKIGLSPLARGTLAGFWQTAARHRFIPAGAGNTRLEKAAMESDAVYPRWRGEHEPLAIKS